MDSNYHQVIWLRPRTGRGPWDKIPWKGVVPVVDIARYRYPDAQAVGEDLAVADQDGETVQVAYSSRYRG